eukprot:GABW01003335.1.p2 GENE.GABW01003335.1~~GABW01003335.1.p2  ORF type:complete len:65 (+),score=9.43 GABW01003335.1:272-466(+)
MLDYKVNQDEKAVADDLLQSLSWSQLMVIVETEDLSNIFTESHVQFLYEEGHALTEVTGFDSFC